MEYSSANSFDFLRLGQFFFFFNFKVNGIFYLFSPQCTAFRLPAPEGTEIALARSAVTLCYLSGALWCIWYYYNFSTLKLFTLPFFKQCIFLLMSIITSAQVSLPVTASYIFVDVFRLCLQLSPFSAFHWDSSTTLLVSVLMTLLPRLGSSWMSILLISAAISLALPLGESKGSHTLHVYNEILKKKILLFCWINSPLFIYSFSLSFSFG